MKRLIIGGAHQGKLDYACAATGLASDLAADGGTDPIDTALAAPCLNHLHLLVRRLMDADMEPAAVILSAMDAREDWMILCDDIGAGVVPIDKTDRRWREETGRLCCALARRADRVERIVCGLPQILKGEGAAC